MNSKTIAIVAAALVIGLGSFEVTARQGGGGGGGAAMHGGGGGGGRAFGGSPGRSMGNVGGGGRFAGRGPYGGAVRSFNRGPGRQFSRGPDGRGPRMTWNNNGRNHRHFRGRYFAGSPYYYGYGAYDSGYGGCGWLYRRAVATGSPYWWRRYEDCID